MNTNTVNLSTLPSNILSKIPFTIRLNAKNGLINFDALSPEIQYLLLEHRDETNVEPIEYTDRVFDLRPAMSVYNDFETINSVKDVLKEYFRNYLMINQGSYPFDPNHGNKLKQYLFMKDTFVAETLINEEIGFMTNLVSSMFDFPVKVKNSNVSKMNVGGSIMYNLEIEILINKKEPFTMNVPVYE